MCRDKFDRMFPRVVPIHLRANEAWWKLPGNEKLGFARPDWDRLGDRTGLNLFIDATKSKAWAGTLPNLENVKYLHLRGKVTRKLFSAVCRMHQLERLDIGDLWVDDIQEIAALQSLQYLNLTGMAHLKALTGLSSLPNLVSLGVNFGRKVSDVDEFRKSSSNQLRALWLAGFSEQNAIRLPSLCPMASLTSLEYLVILNTKCVRPTLRWAEKLSALQALGLGPIDWWPQEEVDLVRTAGIRIEAFY